MSKLPNIIPVFPLSNFILFPKTSVPLNIFEPRYIEMFNESMKKERRGTLLSLFKNGRSEAVRQIVDVLLELTLDKEEDPPPTK